MGEHGDQEAPGGPAGTELPLALPAVLDALSGSAASL